MEHFRPIKHVILYIFLTMLLLNTQSVTKLPDSIVVPLSDSLYREFGLFIRNNQNSPEAYRALKNLVGSDQIVRKWTRAAYSLDYNHRFFKNSPYGDSIAQLRSQFIGLAMTELPSPENYRHLEYFSTKLAPSDTGFVFLLNKLGFHTNSGKYKEAVMRLEQSEHLYPHKSNHFIKLKTIFLAPKENLIPEPIDGINTTGSEWDPNPTSDGEFIFYSYNNPAKGNADVALGVMSDSGFVVQGVLKGKLSGDKDETVDNITYGASKILLSGTLEGTLGKYDIFFAERKNGLYNDIVHLPAPVNSKYTDEGATMSVDEQYLIFTSDRPGGLGTFQPYGQLYMGSVNGNMDIYVSKKQADGSWGEPKNLGSAINTKYSERSPYLHPDGKTLYFSSNGHPGMGQMDVFKSTRLDDTWINWSVPVNLGKEINTISDDWGYKISLDGSEAYFSALNRSIGKGGYDIFRVDLPIAAKPDTLIIVEAEVLDARTLKPVNSKIQWEDRASGQLKGSISTLNSKAMFRLPLSEGQTYGFYVSADGYLPYSGKIDLTEIKDSTVYSKRILLQPSPQSAEAHVGAGPAGSRVTATNLFFDHDKSDVKKSSFTELKQIATYLKSNPDLTLVVEGHTDESGSVEYNKLLSEKRANAVKELLVKFGADKDSIIALGFGKSQPISSDPEKQSENRRVEFVFQYKR